MSTKVLWVVWATNGIGSVANEKTDVIQRRDFLAEKIITSPGQFLSEMPSDIGIQFQGEWAIYSCSMFCKALANISRIYPNTKAENLALMDSVIKIAQSPLLRLYDRIRWGEDPLENINGDKSHLSYLSHLAWMISEYRAIGGQNHQELYASLCDNLKRRMLQSTTLNLPTYPDEPIYVPDMMVAIVALHNAGGPYACTAKTWIDRAKANWIDSETGLLLSILNEDGSKPENVSVKGSYSALNCYYLTLVDKDFAKQQYAQLKKHFKQTGLLNGLKEYHNRNCLFGIDIDAGPIIFNLSPSATAFAIGSATFFGDNEFRSKLLRTAELVGHTVATNAHRHYLLANLALVGEAITLAMRTNYSNEYAKNSIYKKREGTPLAQYAGVEARLRSAFASARAQVK